MPDPTLIIVWIFTWMAVTVMCIRLVYVRINKKPFSTGDYLTMGAIFCALARLSLIHVVLIWGSNNVSAKFRATHHFTAQDVYRRGIGGRLTIVNRLFYNSYLWLQKMVLLDFYRHLIYHLQWEKITMISFLIVFAVSYVIVQVVTFSECRPLHLYWQVLPNPGTCSQAQVQLITLGVLNILTDIMLILLPIPVLFRLRRSLFQKFQLYFLFSLGFFIVAITIVRLPQNANHATAQVNRTTWASAELLTAAFVANAPALYTLCKRKKGSAPPHLQPPLPPKDSNWNSPETSAGSGLHPPDEYELRNESYARAYSHSNGDDGNRNHMNDDDDDERRSNDPERFPRDGILVSSTVRTQYAPRDHSPF